MLTFLINRGGCAAGTALIVVNSTILLKHFFDLLIESWESVENVQSFQSWITEASKALMLQSRAQILILLLLLRNNYLLLVALTIISIIIVIILSGCTSYRDRIASRSEDVSLLDLAGTAHDTLLRVQALHTVLRRSRWHELESICESTTTLLRASLSDSCLGEHALTFLVLALCHSVLMMGVLI